MNNDQAYIEQTIQSDNHAFSVLVDRYKDMVFTLTFRMVKNREDAEELAQDTFYKAYKSLNNFKGDSKFSTWIYRIAYNNCLDWNKKCRNQISNIVIDEMTTFQIEIFDNALILMEEQERRQAVRECMKLLPGDDGFILTVYYFDEKSVHEISKIMGISTSNVKVKLFRSRKKLATIFKDRLDPELIGNYE